jgi:plastocyanin
MSVRSSVLLSALVAAAACSGDSGDLGQGPGDSPGDVQVRNNTFAPSSLQIAPGGTVEWVWDSDGQTHNVTFDDGQHSNDQSSGSYERTFGTAGTYRYHCTFHGTATSGMRGVVTVGSTAPPPDDGGDPYGY